MASTPVVSFDSVPGPSHASHGAPPSETMVVTGQLSPTTHGKSVAPSLPRHDGLQSMDVDVEPRLTNAHICRKTRLPRVPDSTALPHNSSPNPTIPTSTNNPYKNYIAQDVLRFVNHPSAPVNYHSVHPSTSLETSVSSLSTTPTHHGIAQPTTRLRTSNQVFQTGEELALHYGIPTLLPPPPQVISKIQVTQQQSPTADFSTLCGNYLTMLSQKPTDNTTSTSDSTTMTTSDLLSSPHMEQSGGDDFSIEGWVNALTCRWSCAILNSHRLICSVPIASPQFSMEEFLTSPLPLGTPLNEFESSPNETPYSDFLSTPVLGDYGDALLTSPVIDPDLPLFASTDERYTITPTAIKAKSSTFPPELLNSLHLMPPAPEDVVDPASLYPSPAAPPAPTSFTPVSSPFIQPTPEPLTPNIQSSVRRRSTATGTRKNICPEKLIPFDAPTQPRRYLTPSATSKKDVPAVFLKKRQRSEMEDEEDELLEPLPPNATEREQIEYKRRQNTLAARKSRKRKLMHQQQLETKVEELETDRDTWKTRCDTLVKLLQSHNIPPPRFD
ncbi:hypothetical protein AMATHDRAFT_48664 [Amanita thiersii Skay4041]|uniref:BZIP domain-containing protein n=1 Tax=Amanita thiersii Skay4041 TaxID=703135 RepID=A0A2A9NMF5_9AGAR|nr:hypothetical protein AMATHDRAFT_48664 [Amanita thiersii Skay4041]